jgi:hypothetical protein
MLSEYLFRAVRALKSRLFASSVVSFLLLAGLSSGVLAQGQQTIQITANDIYGTNTGTAAVGLPVTLTTAVSAGSAQSRAWTLQGAGTLTYSGTNNANGLYTAPSTMPSNPTVTIICYLRSAPTVTTSYTFTLQYPSPTLTGASPAQVPAGATTAVTLTGTGFLPGAVVSVNNTPVPTTYKSSTSLVAQISDPAGSTAALSVQAQNPAGGNPSNTLSLPSWALLLTATNLDGTNTGTAHLGVPVTFTSVPYAGTYANTTWVLNGAGTLTPTAPPSSGATYTPPATMPANPTVTVTAYISSYPSVTTSYTMTLLGTGVSVTSASPAQLLTGGTQSLTLIGSGFIPTTTVSLGGTALSATYVDYNHETVQVPVPANASGSLSLQVANPGASGSSTSFSEAVAANSIAITASSGSPSGASLLAGSGVSFSAAVTGSVQTGVTWSVAGVGSISTSGVYTAPATVSAGSNTATITAALTSNPAITASYQLNITNPAPTLSAVSPAQVVAGGTTAVTLTGTGFVPGTVILVNNTAVPTTYQSATSVIAQIAAAAGSTSNLSLVAQNPAPGGGASSAISIPTWAILMTATSVDGTNTGTAELGSPVSFSTVPAAGSYANTTWVLQGAGTLTPGSAPSPTATYTPPQTMPTNPTVTVTAYLTSYPTVTTSYTFTLIGTGVSVTSASPAQLLTGGTQSLTLIGSGFIPTTTVSLGGTALSATYVDYNHETVQVPVPANASGSLSLQVANPGTSGSSTSFSEAVATNSITITASSGSPSGASLLAGGGVSFSAVVTGSVQTGVTWSVTGVGSISTSGVYTAPATVSAGSNTATITAALTSNPAITASYQLNITSQTIQITANDLYGTNTGTAAVGLPVTLTTAVSAGSAQSRAWTLQGAGTLTYSGTNNANGLYTAPSTMPSNPIVTIICYLRSAPTVTTSYTFTLQYPSPTLTGASPAQVPAGATTAVTLTGTGFLPGAVVSVNNTPVPTTYKSSTSLVAQISDPAGSTAALSVQAQNPAGGNPSNTLSLPSWALLLTATNLDGTNTGTAHLGVPVTFTSVPYAGTYANTTWVLNGAGTLTPTAPPSSGATYTPPATMPANPTVTVTAYISSYPSVTTSYTMTLLGTGVSVTSASPAQLLTGGTQSLTLIGSGFIPTTTVSLGGTALSATYVDYNHETVQVPVPANASGSLSLQVANPGASGSSTSFSEAVAANSIAITASSGSPSGASLLAGSGVSFSAAVTGSVQTGVTWSVAGVGSISTSGVYTAPATVSAGSNTATITAALTSNPAITASYQLNITNPAPTLSAVSPAQVVAGGTTAVTLTGTGFVPGTVILVNNTAVPTTYQSATSVIAQIAAAAGSTSNLSLVAQNPAPGGGASSSISIPTWAILMTATSVDGTNTGTAELGSPVSFSTVPAAGSYANTTWVLQGAGTLTPGSAPSPTATYTPPQTMPTNPTVTVTAYLTSYPTVTTSYTFTLVSPTVAVTSTNPTQLLTGGTQSLALVGSGFLPGTVVKLAGTALTTTYTDYNDLTVQVPVAANATGNLALSLQNPGGASATFNVPVAANSIALTASNGAASGATLTAGGTLSFSAAVTGSVQTGVTWSVSGVGSISTGGVYTAPSAASTGSSVATITATLTSNSAITATYQVNVVNPAPAITSTTPSQAVAGATTAVTITGTGFTPGTVVLVNNTAVATTYQSATSVIAQVSAAVNSTSNLNVVAQNPAPGGGASGAFVLPTWAIVMTATNSDGTNTGTDRLGVPVIFTTVPYAGSYANTTWVLQGAGTLTPGAAPSSGATYTPPATMPANPSVTVTAYLTSYPSVTTSYTFTLSNPSLSVSSATPAQLLTGGTQTVSLVGAGFLSTTTVSLAGTSLSATYIDYNHESVQVPVAANATGSLSLVVQNPGAGGASTTVSIPVAANSIAITASNGAASGVSLPPSSTFTLTAAVTGSMQTGVTWSVSGVGTVTSAGVYTAPASVQAGNNQATITAALTSNTAITATYQVNITNSAPTVKSASPAQAVAGGTTAVTFTGTGFVTGTVILVNNTPVPTTYKSATSVIAQVSAPAGLTTPQTIQVQNPAPGGGTSNTFSLPTWALLLTATDTDGTNTGTAQLGVPVSITSVPYAGSYATVSWTVTGAGTFATNGANTKAGTYTPPQTMPANSSVTLTAYMTSYPTVTTSYTFTLVNPVPIITSSTPSKLTTGGTQSVTLVGSGFIPSTSVSLGSTPLSTTFTDYKHVTVQVPVPATASGTLSLQVFNPSPGGANVTFAAPIIPNTITVSASNHAASGSNLLAAASVTFSAAVTGSAQTGVTWSVSGPGSISSSGVYTAPASLSTGNSTATITAALTSNPAITGTFQVNLVNAVPTLGTGTTPGQAVGGATIPVTFSGSGFTPNTVILVNGAPVPTTYVSGTSVIGQVTAAYGSTSNLPIQAQNPAPGGGSSNTIQLVTWEVQTTATTVDGTNTGTARLGMPVNFTASASAGTHTQVSWSVQGAGSIVVSGSLGLTATYNPPAIMPSNPTVTVTAYMNSYPSVNTSYTFTLLNPVPAVLTTTPAVLIAGQTQSLELFGTGFVPGTVVTLNGSPLPMSYSDFNDITLQVSVAAAASGSLTMQIQNPTPGGGPGANFTAPIASTTGTGNNGTTTSTVTILQSPSPQHVDSTFNGLSFEKADVAGPSLSANNTGLVNLLTALGPGVIRSGGHSADQVVWTPNAGLTGNGLVMSTADVDRLAAFLQATNWKMIYALNFSIGAPPLTQEPTTAQINAAAQSAAQEAAYVSAALGSNLLGFEIGNEPDLYHNTSNGLRPTSFAFSDYASQWQAFTSAISAAVPNAVFVAPVASSMYATYVQSFVPTMGNQAGLITVHFYAGGGNESDAIQELLLPSGTYATNEQFLTTSALPTLQQLTSAVPVPYRIGEANAFGNAGAPGTAFGTALWGIDFEFLNALNGSSGVNFHNIYPPVDTDNTTGLVTAVNPLYYGMKLFSMAANATTLTADVLGQQGTLSAYALAGDDGSTRVILNNKDSANAVQTTIQFMQPVASGTSTLLSAPSVTSTTGVTLGGAPIELDGTWNSPTAEPLTTSGTQATITVPPGSAVFIDALPVTTSIGIPYDSLCVGSTQASTPGPYVQQLTCNSSDPAQAFAFIPTTDGNYNIRPQNSNLCLDWQTTQSNVQQTTCASSATQEWQLQQNADTTYTLSTGNGQYCLNVQNNSTSPQGAMVTAACNGSASEKFSLSAPPVPALQASSTTIALGYNSMCVDVLASNTSVGPYIVQHACNGASNQSFAFDSTIDGFYTIVSNQGDLCLDAATINASVIQNTCSASNSQKWILKSQGNSLYSLTTIDSQNCLTMPGSSNVGDTAFTVAACAGGANQKFTLSNVP